MVQTTGHHLMNQTYLWYWCKEEYAKRSLLVKGLWIELWLINKKLDVLKNFLLFFIFNISHIFFLSCFWIYFFLLFPSSAVPTFWKEVRFPIAFLNNKKRWEDEIFLHFISLLLCFIHNINVCIYQIFPKLNVVEIFWK